MAGKPGLWAVPKKLYNLINLGDKYEIYSRVVPALIVIIPIFFVIFQLLWVKTSSGTLAAGLGIGGGLEIVMVYWFSKLGHALGTSKQEKLVKKWGDLPTHLWVNPDYEKTSAEQKKAWRKALSKISGLNLEKVVKSGDKSEIKLAIQDAIRECRNKIRGKPEAKLMNLYLIHFGFSKNMAGMKWLAAFISLFCTIITCWCFQETGFHLALILIQSFFLFCALTFLFVDEIVVTRDANTYAQYFYSAVVAIAEA